MKLLSTGNPKTVKGEKLGYLSFILHLAPAKLSGYEVCPARSTGCTNACLNVSGHAGIFRKGETTNAIQEARIRKTRWYFEDRESFMAQLVKDIHAAIRKADRDGMIPVFRLNGTSDLRWETVGIEQNGMWYDNVMQLFPRVQFYDYTKLTNRRNIPANYHLTFSRSEENEHLIPADMNVAVVFDTLPDTWNGRKVIDGTETDLRFLDPQGIVVGLVAKGKAKRDTSGFTILRRAS
jgi:hypothetical protein